MRDTTTIIRPYFRETTEALASLVASRPARDVLLNVAAELQHRQRPGARRLAAEVEALLSGVAAIAAPLVIAGPVREVEAQIAAIAGDVALVPATDFTGTDTATVKRIAEGHAQMAESAAVSRPDMAAAHRDWQAQAETEIAKRDAAKPARKPAARAAKGPGDIGWKPRCLNAIIKSAGNASWSWDAEAHGIFGNVLKAAREFGLTAEGWAKAATDKDGYTTWTLGDAILRVGPYGSIYCGSSTWVQLARDERDRLAEIGRPAIAAAVQAERLRVKRAAAKAKARAAAQEMKRFRDLVRTGKTAMQPEYWRDAMRGKVAYAWKLRAEHRAI